MAECPTRFTLSMWKVGDLSEQESGPIAAHIDTCPNCAAIIAEFDETSAHTAERRDYHLAHIQDRLNRPEPAPEPQGNPLFRRNLFIPALCGAAALIAVVALMVIEPPPPPAEPAAAAPQIAFKGTVSFKINAHRKGSRFEVEPDSRLKKSDELTFSVTASAPGYLAIFSVSPEGTVTAYDPDSVAGDPRKPFRIDQPGLTEIPGRHVLDAAPAGETFTVVFSTEPFDKSKAHELYGALIGSNSASEVIEGRTKVAPFVNDFLKVGGGN